MSIQRVVPFLAVADIARSVGFYVDGLGFEIKQQWRPGGELRWCQIEQGGAALMLQQHGPGQHGADKGEGVVLCIFCDDAVALYRRFLANGVAAEEPYVGNALWVTRVVDPDGYKVDFESPTDAAEETTLSQWEAARTAKGMTAHE